MQMSARGISRRRLMAAAAVALPMVGLARMLGGTEVTAAQVNVTIASFKFDPNPLTIPVGTTVIWTNQDTAPHTATSDTAGLFDTPMLQKGQSGSVTFNQAGTFTYFCKVHPNMHGTVIVTAQAPGTTTAPSVAAPSVAAPSVAAPSAAAPSVAAPSVSAPTGTQGLPANFVRRLGDG
jgi:plastocyanin